jgi:hypothetical protein
MAKPRVFVSSTYYDLRTVRDDLDRFIREIGYEPVRHERGHISYGREESPEAYAYREIDFCDIVVCVVGGRFGTTSSDGSSSITQKELKSAVERGKQVYIFVEDSVHYEHRHFQANKSVNGVRYSAVDDVKIHEFLEEVYALPKGNPVFSFSVSADITRVLREQWAGMFQRLLSESALKPQTALLEELKRNLQTVGQLVEFLTDQKGKGDEAVEQILFANHPLFAALKDATRNAYRLYFENLSEMEKWLKVAKGLDRVDENLQDYPDVFEWTKTHKVAGGKEEIHCLFVNMELFTPSGDIKPMTPASWSDKFLRYERIPINPKPTGVSKAKSGFDDMNDDIPF